MKLQTLPFDLTVCQVRAVREINLDADFYWIGRTDEELSLVCRTEDTPPDALAREDGWRGFRVQGPLDFSLTGVLSRLSAVLAARQIGIFAVSTYNTDYLLVKGENLGRALRALEDAGYTVE